MNRATQQTTTPVRFGRERPYDFTALEELLEADYAPEHPRTVHLACGNGRTSIFLAQQGRRVLGIDPDRDLLAAARERAVLAGVELDFMAGDPLALPPIPEESFALVVDLWTAAEIPAGEEREGYLRRLRKILMRDGILVASAPPPKRRRRIDEDRTFAFSGPFVSDFTRAGFEVLFEDIRVTPPGEKRLVVHARK